jgi:hypothetical protein
VKRIARNADGKITAPKVKLNVLTARGNEKLSTFQNILFSLL